MVGIYIPNDVLIITNTNCRRNNILRKCCFQYDFTLNGTSFSSHSFHINKNS